MSESKVLKPEVIAALAILSPLLKEDFMKDFAERLEVLKVFQRNQDTIRTGMWNMAPIPGTNILPKTPPAEVVYERSKLEAFINFLEARKAYQLSRCKTRKEKVPTGKDGTMETRVILEEPEDGQQRKATNRVKYLEKLITEIKAENYDPLGQLILDFRQDPLISAISDPRFWGRGEGQKSVGMTEKVIASLEAKGYWRPSKSNNKNSQR